MADPDFTFDDSTARELNSAVNAQTTAALKIQAFLQVLRTAFSNTSYLDLTRNGIALPRITLVGTPSIVGSTLQWPAQSAVINSFVAHDIDSGTWTAKIVSISGRIAYPASVGKLTGVVRLSASVPIGSSLVAISSSVISAPPFGGVSPPPPPPPPPPTGSIIYTIDDLVNEFLLPNEQDPGARINTPNWGARLFGGYTFDGYPGGGTRLFPWFEFYPPHPDSSPWTVAAPNTQVELENFRAYHWSGTEWDLVLSRDSADGWWGNHFYNNSNYGLATRDVNPTNLLNGIAQAADQLGFFGNYWIWHGFPDTMIPSTGATSEAYAFCFDARLGLINPSGTDDRAGVNIHAHVAADWYSATAQIGEAFHGRSRRLTSEWKRFGVMNMSVTKQGLNGTTQSFPGAWTEAQLRANPPPFVTSGAGAACELEINAPPTIVNSSPLVYSVAMLEGSGTIFQSWLIDGTTPADSAGNGYVAGQVPNSPSPGNYSNDISSVPPGNYRIWAKVNDGGACQDVFITKSITITVASAPPPSGSYLPGAPPGSGWTTILAATDSPIDVPAQFYGWHLDPGLARQQPMKVSRSWDVGENGGYADFTWAKLQPNQYSPPNWARLRRWVDDTPGAIHMFVLNAIPDWAAKRQAPTGLGGGLTAWSCAPPRNLAESDEFIASMFRPINQGGGGFTASDIQMVEQGNEPKFGDRPGYAQMTQDDFLGGTVVNPGPSEYVIGRTVDLPSNIFFFGTPREMAEWGYSTKQVLPVGVKFVGCGWEQTTGSMPNPYTIRDFLAFMNADAAPGVKGADLFDIITFHTYMYSNDPQTAFIQTDVYRYWLQQLSSSLSRPALANILIANSECGHETSAGWASNFSVEAIATTNRRVTGICAAKRHQFIAHYIDRSGETKTTYPPSGGPYQPMIDAANACDAINGQRIRQAAWKPGTGEIWLRFENNNEFRA